MILKTQNRISASGNPIARGFNFFAHALCAFEGALGNGKLTATAHCSTFASPHEPTLKSKACKRAAILPPAVLRGKFLRSFMA